MKEGLRFAVTVIAMYVSWKQVTVLAWRAICVAMLTTVVQAALESAMFTAEVTEPLRLCEAGKRLFVDVRLGEERCVPCPRGYYISDQFHRHTACFVCDSHRAGRMEKVIALCNATSNVIKECTSGHFRNDRFCKKCKKCAVVAEQCTQTKDTVCVKTRVLKRYFQKTLKTTRITTQPPTIIASSVSTPQGKSEIIKDYKNDTSEKDSDLIIVVLIVLLVVSFAFNIALAKLLKRKMNQKNISRNQSSST